MLLCLLCELRPLGPPPPSGSTATKPSRDLMLEEVLRAVARRWEVWVVWMDGGCEAQGGGAHVHVCMYMCGRV